MKKVIFRWDMEIGYLKRRNRWDRNKTIYGITFLKRQYITDVSIV